MNENKIIKLLQLKEAHRIGSSAMDDIKYYSDIDLEEYVYTKNSLFDILHEFQQKFKKAKQTDRVWITDFKCGVWGANIPIRWNYETIMQGYQYVNNQQKFFTVCLQQQSMIKLDIIALIDGRFVEFSENYYFEFPDGHSTVPNKSGSILPYLLRDMYKYVNEGKKFKALKRLMAFFKHQGKKEEMKKLIAFFNGPVGKFNQQINSLYIILDIMDNTFKPVKMEDIKKNLKIIQKDVPLNYSVRINSLLKYNSFEPIKKGIESMISQMEQQINNDVIDFMKSNKFNISI